MRIISVEMNEDVTRIVAETDDGRIRELVTGVDEKGGFVRWGELEPEPELETFTAYDGDGNPIMTTSVTKDGDPILRCGKGGKQETPIVEWLNIPLTEAVTWHRSGKWEIQMRDSPLDEWVPFSNDGPVYDAMQFRARPKPEALS